MKAILPWLVLAVAGAAWAAEMGEDPRSWLNAEGKNAEWIAATATCRDLLAKLDPDDAGSAARPSTSLRTCLAICSTALSQ